MDFFAEIASKVILIQMDDIVVHDRYFQEHLNILEIFRKLKDLGLKLSLLNFLFCPLINNVSWKGLKIDPAKYSAI